MSASGQYYDDVSSSVNGACICSDAECATPIKWIHVLRVNVRPTARMIHHPVENGGKIFDNKVIEPLSITVTCRVLASEINNIPDEEEFHSMLANRNYKFYSVRSKEGYYDNLELTSYSHQEVPERFSVFDFELQFTQVLFGGEAKSTPSDLDNSSTTT